ncbi:MAG: carboxypeptidase-like regulatory domain-containing protein [Gloeobacteraceae cyanobacterium ES-bin-316]|nr:carboxypeptidase-like regulatory domain-containing protein [Ferruginibacter sp.]
MKEEQAYNRQWGVEDFERYHAGNMPDAEMHALEKAALDDPFLEDALEGYTLAKTPVADVAALREKLSPKKEKATLIWYKQKTTTGFLKIAAIFLVFAGLTWLLYPAKEKQQPEIAVLPKITEAAPSAVKSDGEADSASASSPGPASISANQPSEISSYKMPPAQTEKEQIEDKLATLKNTPKDDLVLRNELAVQERQMAEVPLQDKDVSKPLSGKAAGVQTSPGNLIQGRVVDLQGAPVPFANIQASPGNTNVAADSNGYFAFNNNKQSNLSVSVNAAGFETAKVALNSNVTDNKIVMKQSEEALSEVVVTGLGSSRKRSVSGSVTTIKSKELNSNNILTLKNATPVDGWKSFTAAIKELTQDRQASDTTGSVSLSFDLDKSGIAENIVVTKSLSASCDAQAIRLLQNAPTLKKITKKKKAEAIVRF